MNKKVILLVTVLVITAIGLIAVNDKPKEKVYTSERPLAGITVILDDTQ